MGTDLHSIANHNIVFKNREYHEIAEEIRLKLEELELHNNPFLIHHQLWQDHVYDWKKNREEILIKKDWSYEEEYDLPDFDQEKTIEFHGPLDLSIDIKAHSIVFFEPSYRYWQWFEPNFELVRNEWRKYMHRVVKHFGGNRLVYLPDSNSRLEEYLYFEGTFDEMETEMEEKFGAPKKQFSEILDYDDTAYLIDHFNDLDFNEIVNFDKILPMDTPKYKSHQANFEKIKKYFNLED